MSVVRVNKTKDYSIISNIHLRDKNLSLKAKGLLSLVLSLPDNWNYSVEGLISICKENETSVNSTLKELKENGYLVVTKMLPNQTKTGRIEYEYEFFENPKQEGKKQDLENLGVEILGVENLDLENQGQYNTNIITTNISNTEELNTDYFLNNINKPGNIFVPSSKPKVEPRKFYGEYKRVRLTETQYNKLCSEFGKDYTDDVIRVLDEYTQSNDNKNGWKDFNLVIRRAIRENWSLLKGLSKSKNDNRNPYGDGSVKFNVI